jgi:hypothetical protein
MGRERNDGEFVWSVLTAAAIVYMVVWLIV